MLVFSSSLFRTLIFLVSLSQVIFMSHASTHMTVADELVKLMRLDRLALEALLKRFELNSTDSLTDAKSPEEKRFERCLRSLDPKVFREIFAARFVQEMSNDEIEQAVSFYRGPVGKKVSEMNVLQTERLIRMEKGLINPELTLVEQQEFATFAQTAVGKKLFEQSIQSSRAMTLSLFSKGEELAQKCARSGE